MFYFIKIKAVVRWSAAGKIAAVLSSLNNTKLRFSSSARLKIKLNCSQGRSVWITEHCAPRGKELFVVCPNVRSRTRGESASLSRSRLPVNDNPMEWLIWAGWSAASTEETSPESGRRLWSAQKLSGLMKQVVEINCLHRLYAGCGSECFQKRCS